MNTKLTIDDIKKAFDPLRRARFNALIDYFESKGENALTNNLKFNGEPKVVFHHPELQTAAEESFSFMGCKIRKHHLLPEGMIVFAWDEGLLHPKDPRAFLPESNLSLDGIRKALSLPL
jgi:hypothetical protein